jgi:pyruvate kinase
MKRNRRVKILATLGPASSDPATIEQLFLAGADVFRINMSHTDHARLATLVADIRAIEAKVGRPIGILADLQGPKLRVGKFGAGPVELVAGATFTLDSDPTPGDARRVQLPHPEILRAVEVGHHLLIEIGRAHV